MEDRYILTRSTAEFPAGCIVRIIKWNACGDSNRAFVHALSNYGKCWSTWDIVHISVLEKLPAQEVETVTLQQMTPPAPPVAGDDGLTA